MNENLGEVLSKILDGADEMIRDVLNLSEAEIQERMDGIEEKVKTMLSKKPEDYTGKEKMAAALHFKMIAPTLPHAQAWIVDVFIMVVGFLIRDQKVDDFVDRMEKLMDYIIDYRKSFKPDTEEEDARGNDR